MAGTKYKVGDLVQLKSDGPVMTVQDLDPGGQHLWAQWFAGKKLERGRFPEASLNFVSPEKP
jgi:uncharacterized protein YodC (DUF2158 family)